MKFYEQPALELIKFSTMDVLESSGTNGQGWNTTPDTMDPDDF